MTKELSPKILEEIKKQAEEKIPLPESGSFQINCVTDMAINARRGYEQGQIDAIEKMMGFVEWLNSGLFMKKLHTKEWFSVDDFPIDEGDVCKSYTTTELLEKYLTNK